jgi:LPXTG-motif cell wall-anchored protein
MTAANASPSASAVPSDVTAVTGDTWFARGVTDTEGNLTFDVPAGYAWCLLEHSAPVDYIPDPGMHCSEVLTTSNDASSSDAAAPVVALPETLATIYLSARKYNSLTPNTVIAGATYELLVEGPMPTGYETPTPDGPTSDASGTLNGPMGQNSNDYVPTGDNYWGEGTTNAQGLLSFAVPAGYAWCLHELDAPADYLPDPGFHCTSVLTNQSPATAATIALPEVQKPGGGLAFTGGPSIWMPIVGAALVLTGGGLLAVRRRLERGQSREFDE